MKQFMYCEMRAKPYIHTYANPGPAEFIMNKHIKIFP